MAFSMEKLFQIWNDITGTRLEVGESQDCPELVEIRSYTNTGKIETSVSMTIDEAKLVLQGLQQTIDYLMVKKQEKK